MRLLLPVLVAALVAALVAGCGDGPGRDGTGPGAMPPAGRDGLVAATPRALAAVVAEHVARIDGQGPRRTTGRWSEYGDPVHLEAQVDYGVDPEGTESGQVRTLLVHAWSLDGLPRDDRTALSTCAGDECEAEEVDGGTLIYSWYPGEPEEDPGNVGYRFVPDGAGQVVSVSFDGGDTYRRDPRELGLPVDLDLLRRAVLDPDLRLRTSPEAFAAGAARTDYTGMEAAPERPVVRATTARDLAGWVARYSGRRPRDVGPSRWTGLGPDAVGATLRIPARGRHDGYTVDVLTTVGRPPLLDPMPCTPPPRAGGADDARGCYAFTEDQVATWEAGGGDRPGTFLFLSWHEDEALNRLESVAVRVRSAALTANPYSNTAGADLPPEIYDLGNMAADPRLGPETVLPFRD